MDQRRNLLYYWLMQSAQDLGISSLRLNTAADIHPGVKGWSWNPSPMPDYDFWFVLGGKAEITLRDEVLSAERGLCFLWRPGDAPVGRQDEEHPVQVFFGHFTPLNAEGQAMELPVLPYPIKVQDVNFFDASAHRIQKLWRRGDEAARRNAHDLLLSLLWQLWDDSVRVAEPRDEVLEALVERVRRHPERRWSLDEMAAICHLSRAQFARRFRAAFRTSPTQFLIGLRVERAQRMLVETDMTLEQMAHELGYEDAHFFSRQFHQVTGKWPGAARRPGRG